MRDIILYWDTSTSSIATYHLRIPEIGLDQDIGLTEVYGANVPTGTQIHVELFCIDAYGQQGPAATLDFTVNDSPPPPPSAPTGLAWRFA